MQLYQRFKKCIYCIHYENSYEKFSLNVYANKTFCIQWFIVNSVLTLHNRIFTFVQMLHGRPLQFANITFCARHTGVWAIITSPADSVKYLDF